MSSEEGVNLAEDFRAKPEVRVTSPELAHSDADGPPWFPTPSKCEAHKVSLSVRSRLPMGA